MSGTALARQQLRGAPAQVFHWLRRAELGERVPMEVGLAGPAGTGKSWGLLLVLITLMSRFPKVPGRILICRDTRRSLTNSACATIRKILPIGHPMLAGPDDSHREHYDFGAWRVVLSGLEDPARLYSSEWDAIYVQEAREIGKGPWEEFDRGVRNYALYNHDIDGNRVRDEAGELLYPGARSCFPKPFGLKLLDTNPDIPDHWIKKRARAGLLTLLETTTKENPAYFRKVGKDEKGNDLYEQTDLGRDFAARMDRTTGIRRRRLRDGEWCGVEGAVWPTFHRETHGIRLKRDAAGWVLESELRRVGITSFYAGADYGFDDSGVLLIAGYTRERRLVVLHEVYARGKDLAWWSAQLCAANEHYPLELGFDDHNRPDWRQAFNDALGVPRDGPGAIFVPALKGKDRGLDIVRQRLNPEQKGGPRLFFELDMNRDPDLELRDQGEPTSVLDEIPNYTYKRSSYSDDADGVQRTEKVDPKKENDGCDALEYLCTGVEYIEPESAMALRPSVKYREMLRKIRWQTGPNTLRRFDPNDGVDDDGNDDLDDWIADQRNGIADP